MGYYSGMLLSLAFLVFGFALGVVSLGFIILFLRAKDEALIQDLLDRITARTPGDYLSMIHFRKEHMAQKPGFLFEALKKKIKTPVPSLGEIEMEEAKRKAVAKAKGEEFDEAARWQREVELQADIRDRQHRDTVIQ